MNAMTTKFSAEMKRAREARGITKYRLSKDTGISDGLLSRLESGKQFPSDVTVRRIADALGASYDRLLAAAWADRHGVESLALVRDAGRLTPLYEQTSIPGIVNGNMEAGERSNTQMVCLPLYEIACGEPVETTVPLDWVTFPAMATCGADAALRVRGDSMTGAGFHPGDLLFVEMLDGRTPDVGDEVIAVIDGGAKCAVYRMGKNGPKLSSCPAEGEPWTRLLDEDVTIVASVIGSYRLRKRRN